MMLGVFLIAIGVFALAVAFGLLPAEIAVLVWPMLAIFAGVWLLLDKEHAPTWNKGGKRK